MRCFNFVEVYAAREKNGVYIPKERYYQEESERKVFFLPYLDFFMLGFQNTFFVLGYFIIRIL